MKIQLSEKEMKVLMLAITCFEDDMAHSWMATSKSDKEEMLLLGVIRRRFIRQMKKKELNDYKEPK